MFTYAHRFSVDYYEDDGGGTINVIPARSQMESQPGVSLVDS